MKVPSSIKAAAFVANPMIRDRRVEQTSKVIGEAVGETLVFALDPSGRLPCQRQLSTSVTVHRFGRLFPRTNDRSSSQAESTAVTSRYRPSRSKGKRGALVRFAIPFVASGRALLFAARSVMACRKAGIELLWANDLPTLPAAVLVKRLTGARLVYDSHEIYTERVTSRPLGRIWKELERRVEQALLTRVDQVVTVSPGAAAYLAELHELDSIPLVIRSIPDRTQEDSDSQRHLLSDTGIDKGSRLIAYVGVLNRARGVDLAIEAMGNLPESVHLAVIGYGQRDFVLSLEHLAEKNSVSHRVHFVDPVPSNELVDYLRAADLALIPGRAISLNSRVALPNKLFEAIAAGIPLVVNDKPEITRFMADHPVGLVTNCESATAFSDAIAEALHEPGRFDLALAEARRTISWTNEAEQLRQRLTELCGP